MFRKMTSLGRTFSEGLVSSFHRFIARFSGRRRSVVLRIGVTRMSLLPLVSILVFHSFGPCVEGCSSRTAPKPRPPTTKATPRPNVTFDTYACPPRYDEVFCHNGATCFVVNIGEHPQLSCECPDGFIGERCEFKNLDGSYMPQRHGVMLETASIASGATIAVFLVVVICMYVYMRIKRKHKQSLAPSTADIISDIEKRSSRTSFSPNKKDTPRMPPLHHLKRERGMGDKISYVMYAERDSTMKDIKEPP